MDTFLLCAVVGLLTSGIPCSGAIGLSLFPMIVLTTVASTNLVWVWRFCVITGAKIFPNLYSFLLIRNARLLLVDA